MKRLIILLSIAASLTANAQRVDSTQIIAKFVDSLTSHTTMKQLQEWLFEKVTVKYYNEGKFIDLWQYYINEQFAIWVQRKNKKP